MLNSSKKENESNLFVTKNVSSLGSKKLKTSDQPLTKEENTRVPNNLLNIYGNLNNSSVMTKHVPNPPVALPCLNCSNMAKNFLYLESFMKLNSQKQKCSNCVAVLSHLSFWNKNMEEVFKSINTFAGRSNTVGGFSLNQQGATGLHGKIQAALTHRVKNSMKRPVTKIVVKKKPIGNEDNKITNIAEKTVKVTNLMKRISAGRDTTVKPTRKVKIMRDTSKNKEVFKKRNSVSKAGSNVQVAKKLTLKRKQNKLKKA